MPYPESAWEQAMTVEEVMLKALSGELHWFRAAEILSWSPRTLRRWRERFETHAKMGCSIAGCCGPRRAAYRRPRWSGSSGSTGAVCRVQCAPLSRHRPAGPWHHRLL